MDIGVKVKFGGVNVRGGADGIARIRKEVVDTFVMGGVKASGVQLVRTPLVLMEF